MLVAAAVMEGGVVVALEEWLLLGHPVAAVLATVAEGVWLWV